MSNFDGDQVLDILLAQPETATFITTELWREFISDALDPAQIAPIAERFRESHYDIKTALRGLFLSGAFWDERNRGVLVKSPAEFVVGAVRGFDLGYGDQDTTALAAQVRNFGENLFYPPNVKGWPGGENWINSTTLLARKQFIEQLFRATEAHGMRPVAANAKTSAMSGPMPNMMINAAMKPAAMQRAGLRFDLDAWLAQYNTTPDASPNLSMQLQRGAGGLSRRRHRTRRHQQRLSAGLADGPCVPVEIGGPMNRRDFLSMTGAAGAFSICRSKPAPGRDAFERVQQRPDPGKLKGGNDGLNTVIPFSDPAYAVLRPGIGIKREQVIQLDQRTGLHPAMQPLMPLWKDRQLAIVQGVSYSQPTLSHFRSIEIWDTGSRSDQYLHEG